MWNVRRGVVRGSAPQPPPSGGGCGGLPLRSGIASSKTRRNGKGVKGPTSRPSSEGHVRRRVLGWYVPKNVLGTSYLNMHLRFQAGGTPAWTLNDRRSLRCGLAASTTSRYFFFFFILVTGPRRSLSLKLSDTRAMSLKYETASEPLHIFVE